MSSSSWTLSPSPWREQALHRQAHWVQEGLSSAGLLGTWLPLLYVMNGLRQLEPTQSKCNIREQINRKDVNSGLLTRAELVVNSELLWPQSSDPGKPQTPLFLPLHDWWPILVLPYTFFLFFVFKKCASFTAQRTFPRTSAHTTETALSSRQDYRAVTGTAIILPFELCHITQDEPKPCLLPAEPSAPD